MWLMLPDAFLSIVRHREREDRYLVRARRRDHLERFFTPAKVRHTAHADYPYRAEATQNDVRRIVSTAVAELTYPNFKSEAGRRAAPGRATGDYVHALHNVWATMRTIEDQGARVVPSAHEQDGAGQEHLRGAHGAGEARTAAPAQGRRPSRT